MWANSGRPFGATKNYFLVVQLLAGAKQLNLDLDGPPVTKELAHLTRRRFFVLDSNFQKHPKIEPVGKLKT